MRKFKKDVCRASHLLEGTCDSKLMKSMGRYVLGIKKHGTLKIQDIYSIRGLEHMDRDIAQVLIQGRRMTIKGVLQERRGKMKSVFMMSSRLPQFLTSIHDSQWIGDNELLQFEQLKVVVSKKYRSIFDYC